MRIESKAAWLLGGILLSQAAVAQNVGDIEAYERRIEEQQRQLDEMRRELDALKAAVEESKAGGEGQEAPKAAAADKPDKSIIYRKNEKLALTFSGRVHRMLLNVDDGANTDVFFTDSDQGPTMLRFDALGKVSDTLSVGATIETGIRQNRPLLVSQDKRDAGTSVTARVAEIFLDSSSLGKLSLGRGFAAGWLSAEMDLSGTQFASLLPVGMLAGGMKFVNAADNSLTDIRVLTYFTDLERLLLVDRIRYDSRPFGPGLQVSGSVAGDGRWDAAIRAKPKTGGQWTFVGGAAFLDKPSERSDRRWDAILSARHNKSGLNLTVGGSRERLAAGRDVDSWIVKAGWLTDIVSLGKTAFSVDYTRNSDLRVSGDKGESVGLFAVQKWPEYGIDFYGGYRRYDVSRPDIDLNDLNIVALGLAFNF